MKNARKRPISPHLQIYKPQITSALSILHRITGGVLVVGTLVLVYWLGAIAAGPDWALRLWPKRGSAPTGSCSRPMVVVAAPRNLAWQLGTRRSA